MSSRTTLLLVLMLSISSGIFAQNDKRLAPDLNPAKKLKKLILPALNNKALLTAELERRGPGIAPKFAENFTVHITPETHGEWSTASNGNEVWRMRIYSAGAKSLNLGFTKYLMPEGGSLILYSSDYERIIGPFTRADNEEHEQLWTPILDGDDLIIEVQLPGEQKSNLALELSSINHDFIGFSSMSALSGSCNLDVICGAADGWEIVDNYRDIIQSVAVIGTGNGTFCTGFLINNVNNDCRPFFMTANHCGINANNAASLVAYWNFENSTCREPNSAASGQNGDGNLTDFNTGAVFRCGYSPSDMTLVEFDDPISSTANAFFAGWSAEFEMPMDTIIGIHHPSTDEKRISFEFDPAQPGNGLNGNVVDISNGTHVIVPDWDIGTTEGGSSGSPLFNNQKQVVGQLHGGAAACGNDAYDTYGWFYASWEGGGTESTALKFWLDPNDTGVSSIPGKNCAFNILTDIGNQQLCAPEDAVYTMTVSDNFASEVTLSLTNVPAGATTDISPNPAMPGAQVTVTISNTAAIGGGNYMIGIEGTDGVDNANTSLNLTLFDAAPTAIDLMTPSNEAIDQITIPEYVWDEEVSGTFYSIEIATDETFTNIVDMASGFVGASYFSSVVLESESVYYWRVNGTNDCGEGPWSTTFNFTTANILCASSTSTDVPIIISEIGTPTITSTLEVNEFGQVSDINVTELDISHTWVGDLNVTIESPMGTVVNLFGVSDCEESNLLVSFDDLASNTSTDFAGACDPSGTAIAGTYQPLEALSAFNGEEANGTWTLTVNDNVGQDGGTLNGWDLDYCLVPGIDLSLTSSTNQVEECQGTDVGFDVTLGQDFAGMTTLSASGNPTGTTVSFSENPVLPGSTVTVTITGAAAAGTYAVIIDADDGTNMMDTDIGYIVNGPAGLSSLTMPEDAATDVPFMPTFNWQNALDATEYELQISTDELFNTIEITQTLSGTNFTLTNPLLDNTIYYWRIAASNDCGGSLTDAFQFTTEIIDDVDEIDGNAFVIQPNPTDGRFNINFDRPVDGDLTVELFSIDGRLLQNAIMNPGSNNLSFNMTSFAAGIYLVRMTNGQESLARRIVLQ